MRAWSKTKIIATLGPASQDVATIGKLLAAGADCFRINFSHGNGESLRPLFESARAAASGAGLPIPLLADIQGPKLRIGDLPSEGVMLHAGGQFTLTTREVGGSADEVHTPHEELVADVQPGTMIYLADGTIRLRVQSVTETDVKTSVMTGGALFSHKGINVPGVSLSSIPTLTEKDERDLKSVAAMGFDMVAISFVRSAADVHRARELLGGVKLPVMAKIERPEALTHIDEILEASDGIMLARGDLGVELPLERVPVVQKDVLRRAARAGKWTIVATQMLGSMVGSPRPTRAEASDVANAIVDGADAIMLSEESATGDYPVEAVETMARIAREVEGSETELFHPPGESGGFAGGAAGAAVHAAERLQARAIVTLAGSGLTALLVSKQRARLPILALSEKRATLRRLNVLWGVLPVGIEEKASVEAQILAADAQLKADGFAGDGDAIVVVAALPLGKGRETNTIRFHRIGEPV